MALKTALYSRAGLSAVSSIIPNTTRPGWISINEGENRQIKGWLEGRNIQVLPLTVDVTEYRGWVDGARYDDFRDYYGGGAAANFCEKSLEHYLSVKCLNISSSDICIDIASDTSPFSGIIQRIYGCRVYRQDLKYVPGLHGDCMGGRASELPLPSGTVNKMTLHCSFEHFENDEDIRFIREADRVLARGGRLSIVPLYLHTHYAVMTDPYTWFLRNRVRFEEDAVVHFAKGWNNRHGRFYDVDHFITRIVDDLGDLRLTIFYVENEKEVDPTCYVKFIALLEKS